MNIHFSSCRNEFLFFLMKWLNYQIFQKTQVQYLPRFLYKIRDKIQNLYQNLRKYIPCCFCLYECVLKCFLYKFYFHPRNIILWSFISLRLFSDTSRICTTQRVLLFRAFLPFCTSKCIKQGTMLFYFHAYNPSGRIRTRQTNLQNLNQLIESHHFREHGRVAKAWQQKEENSMYMPSSW